MLTTWRLQCLTHIGGERITWCKPWCKYGDEYNNKHQNCIEREQSIFLNKFFHYALSLFNLGSNRTYDASTSALIHMYAKATHNTNPSING